MKTGILTISDKGSRGERRDTSGPALKEMMRQIGGETAFAQIVPDDIEIISRTIEEWCDQGAEIILTAGGTGFGPRDHTPEATRAVLDRETPGISEAIRQFGLAKTPKAMLSRAISGIRKKTLIINLPGSERGARESLEAVLHVLPHALQMMEGGEHE
jgi:molybdenum cofactor synthesis domain-containing protein